MTKVVDAWDTLVTAIMGPAHLIHDIDVYSQLTDVSREFREGIADNISFFRNREKKWKAPIHWQQVAYQIDNWKWVGEELRKSKSLDSKEVEAAVRLSLKKIRGWKSSPPTVVALAKEIQQLLSSAPKADDVFGF